MTELIMTSIFVFSALYGSPVVAATAPSISASTAPTVSITVDETLTNSQKEVQAKAIKYFKDDPILVEIARCESGFRQLDENGNTLKGKVNKGDLGLMQINKYYHAEKALELGFDLKTLDGNMAYAQYLYDHEGLKPWASSKPCWNQALKSVPANQVALR